MQIILLRDVENLGLEGEIKRVKDGYARNFLIPSKAAVEASANNIKNLSLRLRNLEVSRKKRIATASEKKKMLEDLVIAIKAKTGEKGRLFGSITTTQIAEKLAELGFSEVDKKHIRVPHIKEIGNYFASIKLLESVNASIKVKVEPENPLIDYAPEKKSSRRKRETERSDSEATIDTAKKTEDDKHYKQSTMGKAAVREAKHAADKEISKEAVQKESEKGSKEADDKEEKSVSEKTEKREVSKDNKEKFNDEDVKIVKKAAKKEKEAVKAEKKTAKKIDKTVKTEKTEKKEKTPKKAKSK